MAYSVSEEQGVWRVYRDGEAVAACSTRPEAMQVAAALAAQADAQNQNCYYFTSLLSAQYAHDLIRIWQSAIAYQCTHPSMAGWVWPPPVAPR